MKNKKLEFINKIYQKIPIDKVSICKPIELAQIVFPYLYKNHLFMGNIKEIDVVNGVLYLNNSEVARICEKDIKKPFNAEGYYLEGRILAQQEIY